MSTDNVTDRARGPNSIAPLGTKGEVPTRSNAVTEVAVLAAPAIDESAIEAPETVITAASAATTCLKRTSDRAVDHAAPTEISPRSNRVLNSHRPLPQSALLGSGIETFLASGSP
jgi:hypothetical protein